MIPALFALLLVADNSASPAVAQPAETAVQAEKEKKICKVDPNYTGSRMRKKLCLTETEWAMKAQGKSAADLKTMGAR
jgi:NADPH-dependent ferric siderophore reductase